MNLKKNYQLKQQEEKVKVAAWMADAATRRRVPAAGELVQ